VIEAMPEIPGVRFSIGWENDPSRTRQMDIRFRGDDPATLERIVTEAARRVEAMDGVIGARSETEEQGQDEIRLTLNREVAGKYGLSAAQIGRSLSFAMRGSQIRGLRNDDREVTAYARFERADREDLDTLLDFPLWLPEAQTVVPIRAVTDREIAKGWSSVRRHDRESGLDLVIDLEEGVDSEEGKAILHAALDSMTMPRGYYWESGRRFTDEEASNKAMVMALLLSMTFVFLLMGVLFESLLLPLAVITTIPMALFGVYWTLYFTGDPLDSMAGVGLVVLIGVVVNNGIVLVDLVTRLRRAGMARSDALAEAGQRRLRPIVMTALTTLFGLLPMALGTSTFVGMPYAPLARVVAGGLVAATVLTLFFVPLLYSLLDDIRSSGGRWLAWVWRPKARSR
jgi:HAE1 family hydrophobic/amphiphilic exporter-1